MSAVSKTKLPNEDTGKDSDRGVAILFLSLKFWRRQKVQNNETTSNDPTDEY